jgi:alanine racemase
MYTIKQITSILNAASKLVTEEDVIEQLLTDSRRLIFPEITLFFAIVTQRRDAHNFIAELYERACAIFIVHKGFDMSPV